jgi:epoxide hydrolase-like predicted phosphatase
VAGPVTRRADQGRRLRAVVFDFGGVVITPITERIETLARRHGTDVGTMVRVLLGPQETGDHPWHRAERGELAVAEIQDLLGPWADEVDVQLHGDEMDVLMDASLYDVNAVVTDRVRTLREEGYTTALLTNTFAEFRPTLERDLDLAMFDAVIESYAVGARKPEVPIYEATAAALGVPHDAVVFLADFEQNLATASSLGWTTIQVRDPAAAIAELDAVLRDDA